jgi:hypothetical protein
VLFQVFVPRRIARPLLRLLVDAAVYFNHQLVLHTEEIQYKRAVGVLPAEFDAVQTAVPQGIP